MENYKLHSKLGSGNFAKVYLATHLITQQEVALKLISKRNLTGKNLERVQREINNMKAVCNHENIVSLIDSFETPDYYVLAMEYLPGGELFDYVQERDGLSEEDAKKILRNLATAVQHCHKIGIAHRDLKLENILLDSRNHPKIADFGLSKEAHEQPMYATYCGSPLYIAPEIIHARQYRGPECDIWSLGVILYTMLTATMPFDDSNLPKFMAKVDKADYSKPEGVSNDAENLISMMLNPDPNTRANIASVLSHPWLATPIQRRRKHAITTPPQLKLSGISDCDCTCHNTEVKHHRDSVITKHCDDCEEIVANGYSRPIPQLTHTTSTTSSGYGSEFGSQYLTVESPICLKPRFRNFLNVEERRYSLPRKSQSKLPSGRNSVPSQSPVAVTTYVTLDDDDGTVYI